MAVVSLGMVNTWARFKGQLGGVKPMVQLNSENILTLWKSQMIGNDLVVLRVSLRLSWIYLPLYGYLPREKNVHSHGQRNISGVWNEALVFTFNKLLTWIPLFKLNV